MNNNPEYKTLKYIDGDVDIDIYMRLKVNTISPKKTLQLFCELL